MANDTAEVLATYVAIKNEYSRLVQEDSANRVLGDPDELFKLRLLAFLDEPLISNNCDATFYFQTVEKTLDWPRFRKAFIEKVKSHSNIKFYTDFNVTQILKQANLTDYKFTVLGCNKSNAYVAFDCSAIVNASWHNIEKLHACLGYHYNPHDETRVRTNRLKAMIKVELPAALRKMHSTIFCFGPYCAFTNIGIDPETNKYSGYLTYEPVTNIENGKSEALLITKTAERLLSGLATQAEIHHIATGIINGTAKFIPAMQDAKFIQIHFGYVRAKGRKNSIYLRNYSGAERTEIVGAPIAASAKLLYATRVSIEIKNIIEQDLLAIAAARSFVACMPQLINYLPTLALIIREKASDVFKFNWYIKEQLHAALQKNKFKPDKNQRFNLFSNKALKNVAQKKQPSFHIYSA